MEAENSLEEFLGDIQLILRAKVTPRDTKKVVIQKKKKPDKFTITACMRCTHVRAFKKYPPPGFNYFIRSLILELI